MKPLPTLEKMKDTARVLAKVRNIQINVALEMLSIDNGFSSWKHCLSFYKYKDSICEEFQILKKNTSLSTRLARLHVRHDLLLDDEQGFAKRLPNTVEKKVYLLKKIEQYCSNYEAILKSIEKIKMCNKRMLYSKLENISITSESTLGRLEHFLRNDVYVKKALSENFNNPSSNKNDCQVIPKTRMVTDPPEEVEYMSIGHLKVRV